MMLGLLAAVPRLRKECQAWAERWILPVLAPLGQGATDAEIASALAKVRKALAERADIDPWLGDIAKLGTREYAGNPMAMPWPSQLAQHAELPHEIKRNRYVIEQARRLVKELTPVPARQENLATPESSTKPDGES
jgi:hypothetical protein